MIELLTKVDEEGMDPIPKIQAIEPDTLGAAQVTILITKLISSVNIVLVHKFFVEISET